MKQNVKKSMAAIMHLKHLIYFTNVKKQNCIKTAQYIALYD